MKFTPYRGITALRQKLHSVPVNELKLDGSGTNLSTLKGSSKRFTL
jgi:hypothetical protein